MEKNDGGPATQLTRQDAYLDLAVRVAEIDPAAADYMLDGATKLTSFSPQTTLINAFFWVGTPQGCRFWANIHAQLAK
jgi:hypothetical protein